MLYFKFFNSISFILLLKKITIKLNLFKIIYLQILFIIFYLFIFIIHINSDITKLIF